MGFMDETETFTAHIVPALLEYLGVRSTLEADIAAAIAQRGVSGVQQLSRADRVAILRQHITRPADGFIPKPDMGQSCNVVPH